MDRCPIFGIFEGSTDKEPPTTIRTLFKSVFRPIRQGKSNGTIRFPISVLIVSLHPETSPIFGIFDFFSTNNEVLVVVGGG